MPPVRDVFSLSAGSRTAIPEGHALDPRNPSLTVTVSLTLFSRNGSQTVVSMPPGDTLRIDGAVVGYVLATSGSLVGVYVSTTDPRTFSPIAPTTVTSNPGTPPNTTTGTVVFGNHGGTPVPLVVDSLGNAGVNVANHPLVVSLDPSGNSVIPVGYDTGASPATGMWRGYAISAAAGAVEVNGVALGTATGAGQAFGFTLFVNYNSTAVLSNCTVVGGGISL